MALATATKPKLIFPTKTKHVLFNETARYKVLYGGRGSSKSWSTARRLLMQGREKRHRILCAREFQTSIADSVHKLLSDQIVALGMENFYSVTDTEITGDNGTTFIFKGLRYNIQSIKSMEGLTLGWIEEAQSVSENSWATLIPTLFRVPGFQLYVTFNPMEEEDPTSQRFIEHPPPGAVCQLINWSNNPYFPPELDIERRYLLEIDEDAYNHVWLGQYASMSDAVIFRKRVKIEAFDEPRLPPDGPVRPFYGMDFGFAEDPTALIRCYMLGDDLYISHEAFGWRTELDDTPALMDKIPGVRDWPIKGDNSRPETISFLRKRGFNIDSAEKWQGSVEDGIAHLKAFRNIYIHERCKHIAEEARLYRYKTDPKTNDVLPIIIDKHNHGWDATRYALDGYIKKSSFSLSAYERAYG